VEILGESSAAGGALRALPQLHPEVVIMDAHLPGGIEALKSIKQLKPATVVFILTSQDYPQHRKQLHSAGADIVLDKAHEFALLEDLLRELAEKHQDAYSLST
jgi:DNA-binding NarL/FixJ family response regulator